MSTNRLYDSLLSLPLFLGMTCYDFQNVAGKTRFDFQKLEAGETIVEEGTSCTRLYYLISGDIKVITQADDYGYQVEEDISAPESFQLERLFGLTQRFTHTYVAKNNCSIMSVSKQEIMKLSDEYEIFRINLLNLVCTQSQKNNRHSVRPAGEKIFHIKMTRLAEEMNVKRIYVSKALNELQSEGLIRLERGRIYIPALENLIKR